MGKASYLLAGLLFTGTSALAADTGAVVGGVVGAVAGSVIGKTVGGDNGAVVGAAVGAATGVVIGSQNNAQPQPALAQVTPAREADGHDEHHDHGRHLGEQKHMHNHGRADKGGD
ncbi:MAG: glycine zipper 2TM domain-containing protein [Betaproteobacteria bacterium]|nr:glycine zipper 2TM domain-containing protein [Betaproteobacteria bacterium]